MSPWAAGIVIARKKDGALRFCTNYIKINKQTKRDCYPIPQIDDTLNWVGGAKYKSTMDMTSGYWQLPIREEDKEKTAFISI